MAKITPLIKEQILAEYKAGKTQRRLALLYEVSPATINKICKGVIQENKEIVNTQVAIHQALSQKSEQEVNAINKEVKERTKYLVFFQKSALKNQNIANKKIDDGSSLSELKDHSQITSKNKETVLGKDADVNIQNNNTNNNIKVEFV